MRVLFTTQPGTGHFHPLVPLAAALRDAGHEVAFASAQSFVPQVERAGFHCFAAGNDWTMGNTSLAPRPGEPAQVAPGSVWVVRHARPMASDLFEIVRDWPPDVIIRDTSEYAAVVVAERIGVPHASVAIGGWVSDYRRRLDLAPFLHTLRADFGLPPDPDAAALFRYLHLFSMPPSFHEADRPLAPTAHFFRPTLYDRTSDDVLPAWVDDLPDLPRVYVTLGTVASRTSDLLGTLITAVRGEPVNAIVTVGRHQDPARFGPQPANVHIEQYLPQSLILPRCDAVVSHGGLSTVLGALSFGLPLVAIDLGTDHPVHVGRCAAAGVARTMKGVDVTPAAVRDALRAVLSDPTFRQNAERLRDEMAGLPGVDHAVALVERLAAERQPILSAAAR